MISNIKKLISNTVMCIASNFYLVVFLSIWAATAEANFSPLHGDYTITQGENLRVFRNDRFMIFRPNLQKLSQFKYSADVSNVTDLTSFEDSSRNYLDAKYANNFRTFYLSELSQNQISCFVAIFEFNLKEDTFYHAFLGVWENENLLMFDYSISNPMDRVSFMTVFNKYYLDVLRALETEKGVETKKGGERLK